MAAPIVTWTDNTSSLNPVTNWPIGTIDASNVSTDTTFLIWNNKGGSAVLSDMTSCTITTKDSSGGNTGELVTGKWIEVKVDSMGESTFSPIGGTVTRAIKAGGATVTAGVIKGSTNDGTKAGAADNFSQVTLHANVPATATAGNVDFLTRVSYLYV